MPEIINPLLAEGEFRRCSNDAIYFLEEYWKVQRVGAGYGKFDLFPYQRLDAENFVAVHTWTDKLLAFNAGEGPAPDYSEVQKIRQVRLKARQLGWTTLATGLVFWSAWFHNDHPWLIAAQGQEDASVTMKTQIKAPYRNLPEWMKKRGPQITQDGAEDFVFDNGSRIRVIPSTASSGRGDAMYGALLDEAAFAESAADLFAAVDPMVYGPLYMFSTANGMGNFFHEIWLDSQMSDSEWHGEFRPWHDRPGRDQEWYESTKRKYRNKPHLFYQEYPSTPEEAFLKSGRLALPVERIEANQDFRPPEFRYSVAKIIAAMYEGGIEDYDAMFESALITSDYDQENELWVWRQPEIVRDDDGRPKYVPNYVIAADVSEGLEDGDYDTISVMDANTWEIVATMKAHLSLSVYDLVLEAVGYWYFTALLGPERNNHGMVPLVALQQREYPRLFRMDTLAQIKTADRSPRYGWHTGNATKPKLVADMAENLGDAVVRIHDERFLHEAKTYLTNGKGGYEASSGNHDDLVMAVGISIQLALDVGQSPPIFYDPEPGPPTMGEMLGDGEKPYSGGVALSSPIGQATVASERRSFTLVPV